MKKFYNEPEMAVQIFEAENIVTASEGRQLGENETLDTSKYSILNGTVSVNSGVLNVVF